MSKICISKMKKQGLDLSKTESEEFSESCQLKLHYPPKELFLVVGQIVKGLKGKNIDHGRCCKDFKERAEIKRRKMIQKLKRIYRINVEELSEVVRNEIIMKIEKFEKGAKEQDKKNIDKMLDVINKLLKEQKHKKRGDKYDVPPWRRKPKAPLTCEPHFDWEKVEQAGECAFSEQYANEVLTKNDSETSVKTDRKGGVIKEDSKVEHLGDIQEFQNLECVPPEENEELKSIDKTPSDGTLSKKGVSNKNFLQCLCKNSKITIVETSLESAPKRIVFQDYQKNKTYLQKLKLTNIGLDTIHCRYLGTILEDGSGSSLPIGVAVRDNVKLGPGLSCSTKVRLYSDDDTKELKCSIVYETRRRNIPRRHSYFFVPVDCLPARAIIKVSPLKLVFPTVTWCVATSSEGSKVLRKHIKIENSGGKSCFCKIYTKANIETYECEEAEVNENDKETEKPEKKESNSGTVNSAAKHINSYVSVTENEKTESTEEYLGEYYSLASQEAINTTKLLLDEIINNIFATFRFSEKYHIEIPAFTVKQIAVRFIPEYRGFHHEIHYIQFENCYNTSEEEIEIVGNIKKLPLRVEPQMIDFKTCVVNSGVYSAKFRIYNDSKGPYSVRLKVPPSIRKHASVYPRNSIVQSLSYSDFSLKIHPRITLAEDTVQYYKKNFGILEFPILIHSSNLNDCKSDNIKIFVFALLTNYALELSPAEINFGTVTTLENVRTQIELTNHSLVVQEYGFLNLPKGVRVEPNMGFGKILPKETISLYVLYSPSSSLIKNQERKENHFFNIAVTSIAEYGGFGERPCMPKEDSNKAFGSLWREDDNYNSEQIEKESDSSDLMKQYQVENADEEDDYCIDVFATRGNFKRKLNEQEAVIRNYLKLNGEEDYKRSLSNNMNLEAQIRDNSGEVFTEEDFFKRNNSQKIEYEEIEGEFTEELKNFRPDMNIIKCQAVIVEPYCQISHSVIMLPATPCSSYSLYRFRLHGANKSAGSYCKCDLNSIKQSNISRNRHRFEAHFEFQYSNEEIQLEPQSGFLKSGDSLPITIIYRPKFPAGQLQFDTKFQNLDKTLKQQSKSGNLKSDIFSKTKQKGKKGIQSTNAISMNQANDDGVKDTLNKSTYELETYDLFAKEKSVQELLNPFHVIVKIQCVIKILQSFNRTQEVMTEIHNMILICPAIKPSFLYLGKNHEINFNAVFVGTKSKTYLDVQNISFQRIFPTISLLNPIGSFFCPAGLRNVEVDPEHIWRQPLTYAPQEPKGIEREYFEIRCGSTNIFLTIKGEAIVPEFKMTPNFSCCWVEGKVDSTEEIKLDLENLNSKELKLQFVTSFVREGYNLEIDERLLDNKTVGRNQREDSKDKKKGKKTESQQNNFPMWDDIPNDISSGIENFVELTDSFESPFFIVGLDDYNEAVVPPMSKISVKICFGQAKKIKNEKQGPN